MPVARITAPKRWHRRAAQAVTDSPYGDPRSRTRLARELDRAANRYGLTAEITDEEAELLVRVLPGDEHSERAAASVRELLEAARTRPNIRDVVLARLKKREEDGRWYRSPRSDHTDRPS